MGHQNWYALKTKSRAEKVVSERLTALGIVNYLPIHRVLKKWHDRSKYIDDVLIKGYVFVYLTEQKRPEVFQVYGVTRYLFVNGKIAIILEKEIEHIKLFCTLADVKINKLPQKGDEVEVINGHFIGLQGVVINTSNGKRLQIHLPVLNCFANIKIDMKEVRVINN